jgi:hypothetical protein
MQGLKDKCRGLKRKEEERREEEREIELERAEEAEIQEDDGIEVEDEMLEQERRRNARDIVDQAIDLEVIERL